MAQSQIEIPLSLLKPDPANVRKTDPAPTERFVASIREEGVLEPLTVRPNGQSYFVTNGGKRLAALAILVKEKAIPADLPIACVLRQVDAKSARNISLAVNYHREGMHPVDEFEAFADMEKDGMSPTDIGKKYGLTKREVDQVLALGKLAPEIREAWRKEEIEEDAARVFTLEPDQARQADIFKRLRRGHGLNHWTIRKAIVGEDQRLPGMIAFVGLDSYKAAGGTTAQDLFADKKEPAEAVTDLKLLTKLYEDKLKARIEEIKAEGWKWVEGLRDLPSNADWWPSKGKNSIKADERSKYGVIVKIGYHGEVEFKYGVVKPAQETAAKKKAARAAGGGAEPLISSALAGRLSGQITLAARAVLETDTHLALASLAAALTCNDGPVCISRSWTAGVAVDDDGDDDLDASFPDQLALFRKKSPAELSKALAGIVARALEMGGHNQNAMPLADESDDMGLLEALDSKKLNSQLRQHFDADDYFKGLTKEVAIAAIQACDPKQPLTGKEKKGDLAKLAAELVKKSNAGSKAGYLPPEMRTSHYDGPAQKAAKAKPAKPAAKKKAR